MSITINLATQRPNVAFLALFNSFWNTNYAAQNVEFGPLSIVGGDPSTVTRQATVTGGIFNGERTLNWTRLHIADYNQAAVLEIESNDIPATTADLAEQIGTAIGVSLLAEDVVSEAIDTDGWTYPYSLDVTIRPEHVVWYGAFTVTVTASGSTGDPEIWELPGFTYTATFATDALAFYAPADNGKFYGILNDGINRIARFRNNGAVDSSFTQIDVSAYVGPLTFQKVGQIFEYPDGKILIGATSGTKPILVRYLTNGAEDNTLSLDTDNLDYYGSGTIALPTGLTVQNDGKILMAGAIIGLVEGGPGLFRLNSDGSLDGTFTSPFTLPTLPTLNEHASTGIVVDQDDNIYVFNAMDSEVWKLTSTGSLTSTYAIDHTDDGINPPFGGGLNGGSLMLDPLGNILVCCQTADGEDIRVIRLLPNMSLDNTFTEIIVEGPEEVFYPHAILLTDGDIVITSRLETSEFATLSAQKYEL